MKNISSLSFFSILLVSIFLLLPSGTFAGRREATQKTDKVTQEQKKQNQQAKKEAALTDAREQFEVQKQLILQQVESGQISKKQAREMIENAKQNILIQAKEDIKKEAEKQKAENKKRIKDTIQKQIDGIIKKIDTLPSSEKIKQYNKLLQSIDTKMNSGKLSEKDRILCEIIREVILEAKNK